MREFFEAQKKAIVVVCVLILLDLISKLTAYSFLNYHEEIIIFPNYLSFYLILNHKDFAEANYPNQIAADPTFGHPNFIVVLIGIMMILSVVFYYILKGQFKSRIRLIGLILFVSIVLYFIIAIWQQLVQFHDLPPIASSVTMFLLRLAFTIFLFVKAERKYFKLLTICLMAGNFGNLLSFVYYPHRVIDFIYSPILIEHKIIQVFNFADVYLYFFYALILLTPIYLIYNFIKSRQTTKENEQPT